jgi:RND family efflux transporter MFP subunit
MKPILRNTIHVMVTVAFVALGAAGFIILTAKKPQLKKTAPAVPVPMVRTQTVVSGALSVPVIGEGTVRPLREIQLVPEVSGKVVFTSKALVDGGEYREGQTLLKIDPVDYQLAVTLARARVKDSESALKIVEEEAAASQEEWKLLNSEEPGAASKPPALVAKEPQLAAARARLEAERADLQKALLHLKRTEIRAPFNGRVSAENVDIGQYVTGGQTLATLFSTDAAEIVLPLEDESLRWFHVPGFTPGDGPGSPAAIKARIAGRDLIWQGRVARAEAQLDAGTRLINVIVRVDNPYVSRPPLASGLFVTVEIQGSRLENAVLVPRSALRENGTVWVVADDGRLSFRKVTVARLLPEGAILNAGLENNEKVVISPLKAVTDGMRVRAENRVEDNPS